MMVDGAASCIINLLKRVKNQNEDFRDTSSAICMRELHHLSIDLNLAVVQCSLTPKPTGEVGPRWGKGNPVPAPVDKIRKQCRHNRSAASQGLPFQIATP